jgi:Nuclease-related domain
MDLAASGRMASTSPEVRRMPGQSIRDRKEQLTDNWLVPLYCTCVFTWLLWGWEVVKARTHQPPHPNLLLCIAIIVTGGAVISFGRLFRRYRNLNRGERGEIKVAEVLDELRAIGYRPIHSLKRDGFDIDHVVVGPAGVFAIETKFRSGSGEIEFRNGEGLFVGGYPEEKDCLKQARGNAREVNRLIKEHCGKFHWVTPLVVFVGDWKIKNRWLITDARVLTPDRLRGYFDEQQPELTRSEIKLIASHLERSARN